MHILVFAPAHHRMLGYAEPQPSTGAAAPLPAMIAGTGDSVPATRADSAIPTHASSALPATANSGTLVHADSVTPARADSVVPARWWRKSNDMRWGTVDPGQNYAGMPGTPRPQTDSAAAHPASMAMPGMSRSGCAEDGCGMHGMMHACVFILTELAMMLGVILLGRVDGDSHDHGRFAWQRLIRHTRPPPWTMPSLAEMSILRI